MCRLGFRPLFVVGAQRSGTTFLGERCGRFDDVITTPEAQVMKGLLALGDTPLPRSEAQDAARIVRQDFRFWTLGINFGEAQMVAMLEARGGLGLARALLETYRDALGRSAASTWVEHSPENLLELHWLMAQLPEAKVVHIVRDGRGILGSFRGLDWGPHSARRVADYWLSSVMTGEALSARYPERVMSVRYEDIVTDEATELERIAQFADLGALREGSADGASFALPEFTKAQHILVGGAVQSARAFAWRASLSPRDIEIFEHFAGVGLHHFGYIDAGLPAPFAYGTKDAMRDYLADGWKLLRSKLKRARAQTLFVRARLRDEAASAGAARMQAGETR